MFWHKAEGWSVESLGQKHHQNQDDWWMWSVQEELPLLSCYHCFYGLYQPHGPSHAIPCLPMGVWRWNDQKEGLYLTVSPLWMPCPCGWAACGPWVHWCWFLRLLRSCSPEPERVCPSPDTQQTSLQRDLAMGGDLQFLCSISLLFSQRSLPFHASHALVSSVKLWQAGIPPTVAQGHTAPGSGVWTYGRRLILFFHNAAVKSQLCIF